MISTDLCYNYNTPKYKKQVSNIKLLNPIPNDIVMNNPNAFFNNLPLRYQKVFNGLLNLANKYQIIYPSQLALAKILGISPRHIGRIISDFRQWGLINSQMRFNNSCIYRISSYFFNPETRSKLSWCFSALRHVPLWFLISANCQPELTPIFKPQNKNGRLSNRSNYLKTSTSTPTTSNTILENTKNKKSEVNKVANRNGDSMKADTNLNIPLSAAKELAKTRLSLTQDGVIEIHKFDDRAIMHALSNLPAENYAGKEKLFYELCTAAHAWHKENNVLRNYDQLNFLRETYPLSPNAKMTSQPQPRYEKKGKKGEKEDKKIEYRRIHPDENIADYGRNEEVRAAAKQRIERREAWASKKAANPNYTETQEEAIANVDRWLKSPEGLETQRILGPLTNPFRKSADKKEEVQKEVNPNRRGSGFINSLASALNFNKDNYGSNFYGD